MNIYTITIEQISTGERSSTMIVRAENEDEARKHAEAGIAQSLTPDDFRVLSIAVRK